MTTATKDDAIGETQRPFAVLHLTHFEPTLCLPAHVEAAAVAFGRQEDVIVRTGDERRERFFEGDSGPAANQIGSAEILEPLFR